MASPKDVLKQIADNEVKFVDFCFTDTLGREHHFVPTSAVDEDKLESGRAFDGSSIPGWKGIRSLRHAVDSRPGHGPTWTRSAKSRP